MPTSTWLVQLISGETLYVSTAEDAAEEVPLRAQVARMLEKPAQRLALLLRDENSGVEHCDEEILAFKNSFELPPLTVVITTASAKWLDEFLSATPPESQATDDCAQDARAACALSLKSKVQIFPMMEALAGLWKYGPRREDPRSYGILLESDGSCRIVETLEDYSGTNLDDEWGEDTESCEWVGIWSTETGIEVTVEAFPLGGRDLFNSGTKSGLVMTTHGQLSVARRDIGALAWGLHPVQPYGLKQLVDIPRSRSLHRSKQIIG